MKIHHCLHLCILLTASAEAQVFTTNSLPCQIGEYSTAYFASNVDVAPLLALANSGPPGPGFGTNIAQIWDFSKPLQPNEAVLRTDIIQPQNGNNGGLFPNATYAEQQTFKSGDVLGWRYFGFTGACSNGGRLFYGADVPNDQPVTEYQAFFCPTIDIPASVQCGQTWCGAVRWCSVYFAVICVTNYYHFTATADAFGTMKLPQIGVVPAIRVHETDSYAAIVGSSTIATSVNQYYYWLTPGIGIAAEVTQLGNNDISPITMPYTNTVQRMFYASYFTNVVADSAPVMSFPTNLSITPTGTAMVLDWTTFTNAINYRVDYTAGLPTNWQTLGFTGGNSWTDTLSDPQRFYRVVGIP